MMIFDRTQEDIEHARSALDKLKSYSELTENDLKYLERATANINTINRIENAEKEVYSFMLSNGYYTEQIETKEWTKNDIFEESDFKRIIENLEILRNSFFEYSDTPKKALLKYDIEQLNAIEKILFDFQSIRDSMVLNFKECGVSYCGEG